MSLTGEDPLKDKGVSIIAPQFSPGKRIARSPDGVCIHTYIEWFALVQVYMYVSCVSLVEVEDGGKE